MPSLRTIRLIFTFYKSFVLPSLLITACCGSIFWKYGFSIFSVLCWFKLATLALTVYFINSYKKKEFYYYLNLGISKRTLWISALTFDFTLFIFLITQLHSLR